MSLFGHHPPRVPDGGRAWAALDTDALGRDTWCVRVQMPGEEQGPGCKRISPVFQKQTSAYAYLDWIEGGPRFVYPADGAA